jgi:2-keto-4-pentenoate hydratase/2-oxohepta-3-ene-1,7-dioic acid hydratase in catechol pathway
MKIIRFFDQDQTHYGILEGEVVRVLAAPPYAGLKQTGQSISLASVKLLAPCEPTKIIALGLNYRDHAQEMRMALPQEPLLFMKPSTSVTASKRIWAQTSTSSAGKCPGDIGMPVISALAGDHVYYYRPIAQLCVL